MTTTGSRSVARRLALTVTGHDSKHLDSNGMCVCRCTDCRKRLDGDTSRCVCPDCVEDGLTNDSSIRLQSHRLHESGIVLDLFAGPGGWDEGVRDLGLHPVGVEWDDAACRTAMAAGHTRVRADVEALPTEPMVGKVWGLIASPPCQDFSLAGKQAGITGKKGRLITQVLRWTNDLRPRWVACEQVPPCLPVWEEYAEIMRGWGYRTWTGVLNAADYGVPQTRKRAILLASLDRQPTRPEPTHARGGDVDLFAERQPWISMAQALGWKGVVGFPCRADTPSNGATDSVEIGGVEYRARDLYPTDGPAQVVTEKARSWVLRNGAQANATERRANEPAPTLVSSMDNGDTRWVVRTGNNSMVTGRTGSRAWSFRSAGVTGEGRPKDPETQPADTLTGKGTAYWEDHPATTIVSGSNRSSSELPNGAGAGSVRVSVEEAAILQSFPADYPWQGSRTKQFEQVGNAVPPRLALHVVAEVLGVPVPMAQEAAA